MCMCMCMPWTMPVLPLAPLLRRSYAISLCAVSPSLFHLSISLGVQHEILTSHMPLLAYTCVIAEPSAFLSPCNSGSREVTSSSICSG